jgi:hypothetical protein
MLGAIEGAIGGAADAAKCIPIVGALFGSW